jgi:hypothetical protein
MHFGGQVPIFGQTCCCHLQDIRANHATKLKYKYKERRDRGRKIERTKEASREERKEGWDGGQVPQLQVCLWWPSVPFSFCKADSSTLKTETLAHIY